MKTRDADLLILPGLGGSGPEHWQTRWQAKLPTARRVEQPDWDRPVLAEWTARLAEVVAECDRPVVLVAHSLGVILAAHGLSQFDARRVAGAFLVAPPSAEAVGQIEAIDQAFLPYPAWPMPCPSMMVASTNDPYASLDATMALASDWGSAPLNAGASGHINAESGHGPWPEGLMAFAGFLSRLEPAPRVSRA